MWGKAWGKPGKNPFLGFEYLHQSPGLGSFYCGISASWLRMSTFGTLRHGLYGVIEKHGKDCTNGQVEKLTPHRTGVFGDWVAPHLLRCLCRLQKLVH